MCEKIVNGKTERNRPKTVALAFGGFSERKKENSNFANEGDGDFYGIVCRSFEEDEDLEIG